MKGVASGCKIFMVAYNIFTCNKYPSPQMEIYDVVLVKPHVCQAVILTGINVLFMLHKFSSLCKTYFEIT